jgi:integrase-like protein
MTGSRVGKDALGSAENQRQEDAMARRQKRNHGTGTLYVENGVWHGRWLTPSGGRPNRRVGPARKPGTRGGMTRVQAEPKLRGMMDGDGGRVTVDPARTVEHVGRLHLAKLIGKNRKRSHTDSFESHLRVHLAPFFGTTPISRIESTEVERLMAHLRTKHGLAPKTIRNIVGTLHAIFDYALAKKWVPDNPCRLVEWPEHEGADPDIHFLTHAELEATLRAIPDHDARGKLTWEQVCAIRASTQSNVAVGASSASRTRWSAASAAADLDRRGLDRERLRGRRPRADPDRGADRDAPGRATGAALARRRLVRAEAARPPRLRARRVRDPELQALQPRRPVGDARRRRPRRAAPWERVPGRRRPRVRSPAHGQPAGPLPGAQALQALPEGGGHPHDALPRLSRPWR